MDRGSPNRPTSVWEPLRSFWESTNRRAREAVAAAARRQPPPEEQAPPRPRVPYQQGREFVVRAESVFMLAGESVQAYVARVDYEVFRFNTVFDLTDEDRGHILWNGLRREIRQNRPSLIHVTIYQIVTFTFFEIKLNLIRFSRNQLRIRNLL